MKVEVSVKWYSKELLQDNSYKIFVFGDNLERRGKGGQAVIRHERNSFGLATKVKPSTSVDSFFEDSNPAHYKAIEDDLLELKEIGKDTTLVFPSGGLGNGLSQMHFRCPKLFSYMNALLLDMFGVINCSEGLELSNKSVEE